MFKTRFEMILSGSIGEDCLYSTCNIIMMYNNIHLLHAGEGNFCPRGE
jgi:hypothetical protein